VSFLQENLEKRIMQRGVETRTTCILIKLEVNALAMILMHHPKKELVQILRSVS